MNSNDLQKLDNLSLELNANLCLLKSAVTSFDEDLEVYDLIYFVEKIYKLSNQIRKIFNN